AYADAADLHPAPLHLGVAEQRHGMADVLGGVWSPNLDHHAAHGLAGAERAAFVAFKEDVDRLFCVALVAGDFRNRDGPGAADQIVGIKLIGLRSNKSGHIYGVHFSSPWFP